MPRENVTIVGAGQAGLQVALSLRQGGFEGEVVVLGREAHPPYQRPPLSKQLLKGEWSAERCALRKPDVLEEQRIEVRTASPAAELDPGARTVTLADGEALRWDHLVIATGSALRRLSVPGADLPGVHYLRTLDHAEALRDGLAEAKRLVIAGGGYIGLEVAASARALGVDVVVVEAREAIMMRSALAPVREHLLETHRQAGVDFRLGRLIECIEGTRAVEAVRLDDGERLGADLVLVGVGVRPDIGWLEGSGVETGRGVVVDGTGAASVEGVYAAGDVCEFRHPRFGGPRVLESVQNAVSQGRQVASAILGEPARYDDVPWFWSEQHGHRLQMAGLPGEDDELVIRETGPQSLSVLSVSSTCLNAAQCIDAAPDYMAARKLIAAGDGVPLEKLKDPRCNLKELL
jgi:3-phenylpropionate/trans-cinnamate dioxygenase ferredoxin reductase subunit